MTMTVFLTSSDMERVERLAHLRNSKNGKVVNNRRSKRGDYAIHIDGIMGELAVCKAVQFPIDERFSWTGDTGADLFIGDLSAEVKSSSFPGPDLKFNGLVDFTTDIAVLCQVYPKDGAVTILGGISRRRFSRIYKTRDYGHGPRAICEPGDLEPFERICEYAFAARARTATTSGAETGHPFLRAVHLDAPTANLNK